MAGYICTVCRTTADSKCVRQRSVFGSNGADSMFGNVAYLSRDDEGRAIIGLRLGEEWLADGGETNPHAALIRRIAHYAAQADPEGEGDVTRGAQVLGCVHRWEILPGQVCLFGCCDGRSHEEREAAEKAQRQAEIDRQHAKSGNWRRRDIAVLLHNRGQGEGS